MVKAPYTDCINANTLTVICPLDLQGVIVGGDCVRDPQDLSVLFLTSACGFIITSEEKL